MEGDRGVTSLRVVGEERAGDGTPKGMEKWEINFTTLSNFRNRISTERREPLRKGAGTGSTRYKKQEIQTPVPP